MTKISFKQASIDRIGKIGFTDFLDDWRRKIGVKDPKLADNFYVDFISTVSSMNQSVAYHAMADKWDVILKEKGI